MAFATKNCLVTLHKLDKTLVASVDEVNDQPLLHYLYIIICHLYIIVKINNLHDDMANEKGLKFLCFKNRL
jgi:hypothetical protein